MKEITFNAHGQRLFLNIEMLGLYFITYTYQLWAATASEPAIVTNPIRQGSNESPHDDLYEVRSDYAPDEPVARNHERVIDVRFWVKAVGEDNGYRLRATIYQGDNGETELGSDEISGTVDGSIKEEFIAIKLIAAN